MVLWNQKHLPAPPTNTYKSKTKDLDLLKLRNALQDCIKHFKNEDFLIKETALLSRILYRMKMKFRSSKEFKSLEKINHSLIIYLNTNMRRYLQNIFDLVPYQYKEGTYLPTRNMLSYILVRIQGLVKLMERLYDTCQKAAYEINSRIALGHFWRNYVILFALVSRIYVLVKYNTKLLCELYGKLLPHSNKLENPGRNWLPEGYELPSDLREWLGVDWVYEREFIDLTQDLTLNPSLKILDLFNLVDEDDDEVQFCEEYVLIDEEDKNIARDFKRLTPIEETFTRNRMRGFSINEDDIGEDIAEIINSNETSRENNTLENAEKDKENSHLNQVNEVFDIEDVGEEISSTETNTNHPLQIINLVETDDHIDRTMKFNSGLTRSRKKGTPTSKSPIIDLADTTVDMGETGVIIIPETPPKKTQDKLEDHSVIVVDDTISNNLLSSKTLRKREKKQRKSKAKRILRMKEEREIQKRPITRYNKSINLIKELLLEKEQQEEKHKNDGPTKRMEDTSVDNKNANIIGLTVVKEIPKVEHINQTELLLGKKQQEERHKNDGPTKRMEDKMGNKNTNIVRLTVMNEIPKGKHINQKKDPKGKSLQNTRLIPSLETPIKAILNVDSLRVSTNGRTSKQKKLNESPASSSSKQEKFQKGDRSLFNITGKTLENKGFKEESAKTKMSRANKKLESMDFNRKDELFYNKKDKKRKFDESSLSYQISEKEEFRGRSKKGRDEVWHSTLVDSPKTQQKKNEFKKKKRKLEESEFESLNMSKNDEFAEEKSKKKKIEEPLSKISQQTLVNNKWKKQSLKVKEKKGKEIQSKESLSDMFKNEGFNKKWRAEKVEKHDTFEKHKMQEEETSILNTSLEISKKEGSKEKHKKKEHETTHRPRNGYEETPMRIIDERFQEAKREMRNIKELLSSFVPQKPLRNEKKKTDKPLKKKNHKFKDSSFFSSKRFQNK